MKKQILAATVAAILVVTFVGTTMVSNVEAIHRGNTSGQNTLGKILTNLQTISSNLDTANQAAVDIREDLKVKKKFHAEEDTFRIEGLQGTGDASAIILRKFICELDFEEDGTDPCAFNVESIIVTEEDVPGATATGDCVVDALIVDGLVSDIPDIATTTGTGDDIQPRSANILLEADIPLIGASDEVGITIDCENLADITVAFTGERPQHMTFVIEEDDIPDSEGGL
jgi:hypothetical protein